MTKNLCLLLLVLSNTIFMYAQKNVPEFGKISTEELTMKSCSFEPDANAMKLLDTEEAGFDLFYSGTKLKTEKRVRIKIFNERGYKYATIHIPYFSKKGIAKIKELRGAIYSINAEGKTVTEKLDRKDFFKEKAAENIGMVTFTFPNLKSGCVIEYSYTTVENNINFIKPWLIQDEFPVLYTSRTFTTPVQSKIFEHPYGTDSIASSYYLYRSDQYRSKTYYKENIPSFVAEPYMNSVSDNLIRATFLFFPFGASYYENSKVSYSWVWQAASKQLIASKFFEEQVYTPIPGTEKIIDSANKISNRSERIGYVFEEVKKIAPLHPEQTTKAENLTDAWINKDGTSSEINLILLNILMKCNIPSMPLLISTRDNGKINKEFPSQGQLDGIDVLAFDSTTALILDAGQKFQSYLNPPLNILNREAFLIGQDSSQLVVIRDNRPLLKQVLTIAASMNDEGILNGTATVEYYDYAKSYKLDTTLLNESNKDGRLSDRYATEMTVISSSKTDAVTEDDPLTETIQFRYEPSNTNDFVFITPQLFSEKIKNPFVAEKRNTDLDFGCNQLFKLNLLINLPKSYVVEHLPKNISIASPDSGFFYKITYNNLEPEKLVIEQSFEVQQTEYSREKYSMIQAFFKKMFGLMAEEIIVKKKK